MVSQFKKFLKLSGAEKKIFLEAYLVLGVMRIAILTISFERLTRSLKHQRRQDEIILLNRHDMELACKVGQSIRVAASYTPWESACLVQSLTAQRMLQKRGIPGVMYLGVKKDETGAEAMKAHAWSQCGNVIIIGGGGAEAFTVISAFAWEKS